jgi:hydrogenase nickel incorporation protein HypA/HybF
MHESAVAQDLLETISQQARLHDAKPIRAKMSCGQLNAINDEVLRFAFEAISKGTRCEGMALDIEHKPLQARCKDCAQIYAVELPQVQCPQCRCDAFELLPDAPLILEEIEFEKE